MARVPSAYTEAMGFMSGSATSHQGAIEMFWLHFRGGGAFMLSIFIYVSVSHPEDTEQPHHSVMLESCLATTKTTNVHESDICPTFCSVLISDRNRCLPLGAKFSSSFTSWSLINMQQSSYNKRSWETALHRSAKGVHGLEHIEDPCM